MSAKRTQIEGLVVVGVFDFGFGERGAVMHAPVHGLQTFIDVAAIEKVDEGAGDDATGTRRSS